MIRSLSSQNTVTEKTSSLLATTYCLGRKSNLLYMIDLKSIIDAQVGYERKGRDGPKVSY